MAQETDTLLFQVILDIPGVREKAALAISAFESLKKQKKELDLTFATNKSSPEYARQIVDLNGKLKQVQTSLRGYEKTLQDNDKAVRAAEGSIEQMGAQIAIQTSQYVALGKAQRDATGGQELKKNIKDQSDAYKELYSEIGKDQLNVGNYADTILGATQATQGFAGKLGD